MTAATTLAVLLYAAHNGVAMLAAWFGGHWIDRSSPRRVFAAATAID